MLSAVNAGATHRANTAALLRAVDAGEDLGDRAVAGHLLVHPLLAPLFMSWSGLLRGATAAVTGGASLLLALLDGAMRTGGWAAVAGLLALGIVAAHEHGIPIERLALVPNPGLDWSVVVAALLDGLDMVVAAPPGNADATMIRTLAARARARGAVLVTTRPWVGCDLTLTVTRHDWAELGIGRGRLRWHEMTIRATGRGAAIRAREVTVPVPLAGRGQLPAGERPVPVELADAAGRAALSAWRHGRLGAVHGGSC